MLLGELLIIKKNMGINSTYNKEEISNHSIRIT